MACHSSQFGAMMALMAAVSRLGGRALASLLPDLRTLPGPVYAALADIVEQRFREAVRPHAIEGDWHLFGAGEGDELIDLIRSVDLAVFGQTSPD